MNFRRSIPVVVTVLLGAALPAAAAGTGAEFWVAPGGDDGAPGTRERPFATPRRARDAVRERKTAGGLPAGGITVWIRGGSYFLDRPLELSARDSGGPDAPITYRAVAGGTVRLVGGPRLTDFRAMEEREARARLDEKARGHVVTCDLQRAGVDDLGQAVLPGRRPEVFFDLEPLPLARWPDEGFVRIRDVAGLQPFRSHGIPGDRAGALFYDGDRPARWVGEKDAWLHGYWFWDWSDSFEKIGRIDVERQRIETAPPYHRYGYRKGQRFYAINVLAELDRPGEWYVDRDERRLYLWPPRPVQRAEVLLSVLPSLVVVRGASHVRLAGLILEAARSHAVTVEGGEDVQVLGCTVRNVGGWAVRFDGGKGHRAAGCEIHSTGEGGISLRGGDRRTLTAAGHAAEHNHIHHFARVRRTYQPAVAVEGVGQRVAHNHIHDAPHCGILLSGNDHLIELNEIDHVCYETGDVGAFYTGRDWSARGTVIRHNFFHDIEGPGMHGAMAVYLDDAASGFEIVGNVFWRAGRAAFIGGGRDNRVENNIFVDCRPSVHVDARGVGWMRDHIEKILPERLRAVPYREEPWRSRYPQLLTILDDEPGLPKGNVVRRNISVGGVWSELAKEAEATVRFEDNLVDEDPHFADAERGDFRLGPDSPAWKLGFERIPLSRVGPDPEEVRRAGAPARR